MPPPAAKLPGVIGKRRTAQWETKRKIKLTYNIVKQ